MSRAFKNGLSTEGPVEVQDQEVSRPKFKDYALTVNARGSISGAQTIDYSLGNYVTATASGAIQWTVTNPPATGIAGGFILKLTNGGAGAQTWMSGIKWPGGVAPTLVASGVDILVFTTDDAGTTWRGVLSQADSK